MSEKAHSDKSILTERPSDTPFFKFPTFMDCKLSQDLLNEDADVVVSGVPLDLVTTERPGVRFGPAAIRQASTHLVWEPRRWPWGFNVFDEFAVVDCGDLGLDPAAGNQLATQLQQHASQIIATDQTMLTLGGDHFIMLPLLREHF